MMQDTPHSSSFPKRKRFRLLLCLILLLLLLLLSAFCVGNFFFNSALLRQDSRDVRTVARSEEQLYNDKKFAEQRKKNKEKGLLLYEKYAAEERCIETVSFDGLRLKAFLAFPAERRHENCLVLLVHGYKDDHHFMKRYAARYLERGYAVLLPDNRAHGQSEGRYIGMSVLDQKDILSWMDTARREQRVEHFILHGVSMGAASVINVAGSRPKGLLATVEDCGYSSVWGIFSSELKARYSLPSFPILHLAELVCRFRARYGFRDLEPLRTIRENQSPILLIHGEEDDFVPYSMMNELYAAADPALCEKYSVPRAAHAQAEEMNPDAYWEAVFRFLRDKAQIREA